MHWRTISGLVLLERLAALASRRRAPLADAAEQRDRPASARSSRRAST